MPLLFNRFFVFLASRILHLWVEFALLGCGCWFIWNDSSSVTVILMNTCARTITCLAAHMVINLSLQNLICHILKSSTFCLYDDIPGFLGRGNMFWREGRIIVTIVDTTKNCLIQQLLRNRGAARPNKRKYNIYSFSSTCLLQRFWLRRCWSSHHVQELAAAPARACAGNVQRLLKLLFAIGDHQSRDVWLNCKMRRCYETWKVKRAADSGEHSMRRQIKSIHMLQVTHEASLSERRAGSSVSAVRFVHLLSVHPRTERTAVESYVKYVWRPQSGERFIFSQKSKTKKNKKTSISVSKIFN